MKQNNNINNFLAFMTNNEKKIEEQLLIKLRISQQLQK